MARSSAQSSTDAWNEVAQRPVTNDDMKATIEAIALNWLVNAPTFKFDGVKGSAKVVDSWLAMTFVAPSFWGVTIEFDCLHAGYGDRSDQMLAQVITHHVAKIHVTEGAVNFAVIDDKWDEVKQVELTPSLNHPHPRAGEGHSLQLRHSEVWNLITLSQATG